MTASVLVVIVAYRSRSTIAAALRPLAAATGCGLTRITVVDNASADGTADYVREAFPWVTVLEAGDNLGFARACNLGAEGADTPYVLLLNPDAILTETDLRELVRDMETRPDAAIITPATLLDEADIYQHAGALPRPWGLIAESLGIHRHANPKVTVRPGDDPQRVEWICGGIMLVRTRVWQQLGGFDPRFFLYFEETDFCKRVAEAGFTTWVTGRASGWHTGGVSVALTGQARIDGMIARHYYLSRYYYLRKHYGFVRAVIVELLDLLGLAARSVRTRWQGQRPRYPLLQRLREPLLSLPAMPPKTAGSEGRCGSSD